MSAIYKTEEIKGWHEQVKAKYPRFYPPEPKRLTQAKIDEGVTVEQRERRRMIHAVVRTAPAVSYRFLYAFVGLFIVLSIVGVWMGSVR